MPLADRYWAKVSKDGPVPDHRPELGPCWRWTGATASIGYGVIQRGEHGAGITQAHRVSWELHNGPIPDGLRVLHHCDNPPCSKPAHLFLGTMKANTQDMMAKGRARFGRVRGEKFWSARLAEADVREIRRLHAAGANQNTLARQFGVSQTAIWSVVHRRSWKHVA